MALPDVTRLSAAAPELLRAFGKHLADIGLTLTAAARATEKAALVAPSLRRPVRNYHLRRQPTPVARALRMLVFADPVNDEEARATFGSLLDPLLDAGILVRRDDGSVVSPFSFALFDDICMLADDLRLGSDAVMGLGETTISLCRAALPPRRVRRALDLGCGAGAVAFALARTADHVVATDINPRAITLARANAAINGVTNVELRVGSLFEPVAGETFDLVVSQPPFVSRPSTEGDSSFLFGGRRGDELAVAVLRGVGDQLSHPAGRAVMFVEWPEIAGDPLLPRVRDAVGRDDVHVLLLKAPTVSSELHASSYAAGLHPHADDAYDRAASCWLEHLESQGISGVSPTVTVVQRAGETPIVSEEIAIRPLSTIAVTGQRIDRILAARALLADEGRLLAATLRIPEGTTLSQEQREIGPDAPSTISARFGPEALVPPIEMSTEMLIVVTMVHEAPDVRSAVARFEEAAGVAHDQAFAMCLPAVRSALGHGLLEVRDA
ncbi:MAG: methyltransferase [Deltaproteobacteria bacterium]|nr:methyltransferase [Deltaproteobacteria bacterium]